MTRNSRETQRERGMTLAAGIKRRRNLCIVLAIIILGPGAGCTLRPTDNLAPSLEADLETQYELARWGDEKVGLVPSPPEVKEKGIRRSGVGLQVRGKMSNTFTWMNPEGTIDTDYTLFGERHVSSEPVEASGWGYRGRMSIMPGLSFADDQVFFSPLFLGVEGSYIGLEIKEKGKPASGSWGDFGQVGIPIGFHVEGTIARTVTPSFTFAYVPTIYNGGTALTGQDFTFQVAARLWPGSLIPAMGSHLWVEAGWLWTLRNGGVGWRF